MKNQAIICDLDGTVLSNHWRSDSFIRGKDNEHYYGIPFDPPIQPVLDLLKSLYHFGIKIHYTTGRWEKYRMHTLSSFEKYDFPPGNLWMRPYKVQLSNSDLKNLIFWTRIAPLGQQILFAIDDNPHVVAMYKESLDILCLQVSDPKIEPIFLATAQFGLESLKIL